MGYQSKTSSALALHGQGDLDQAEDLYRQELAESPDFPDALHWLGILLHQRGQAAAAVSLLERSIALVPGNAAWRNDLGNMLTEQWLLLEAPDAFLSAIQIAPNDADLWNNLGSVFQRQELLDPAANAYQQAILLKADFSAALQNYALVLTALGVIATFIVEVPEFMRVARGGPIPNGAAFVHAGVTEGRH